MFDLGVLGGLLRPVSMLVESGCSLGGSSQMPHSLSCQHPGVPGPALRALLRCFPRAWPGAGKPGRALGTADFRELSSWWQGLLGGPR